MAARSRSPGFGDTTSINLNRLLSRLDRLVLVDPSPQLRKSNYERARVSAVSFTRLSLSPSACTNITAEHRTCTHLTPQSRTLSLHDTLQVEESRITKRSTTEARTHQTA